MTVDTRNIKQMIARRVAKELKDGQLVNLGIGLPTLVANYVPENISVILQSENGMVGMGESAKEEDIDINVINAGGQYVTISNNGAFFDTALSFSLIRGGHVDVTVLGALEVDKNGNLANWSIPGKYVPGMGGAMDLVTGAKKVIIAMTHTAKGGKPKIFNNCRLPLTAAGQVNLIVTELAVMEVTKDGLVLKEINKDTTLEEVQALTETKLIISEDFKQVEF